MFLRIVISDLSPNEADYFLRKLTEKGAEGSINFGSFRPNVIVTQSGCLEDLLQTASVAFHADIFRVEISG